MEHFDAGDKKQVYLVEGRDAADKYFDLVGAVLTGQDVIYTKQQTVPVFTIKLPEILERA